MNKKLIVVAILLFVITIFLKFISNYAWQAVANTELKIKQYNVLSANWGNKKQNLEKLNAIVADFGTKYQSVTINQKRVDGSFFMVAFLVLNSDELDTILKRIIDDNFVIKKLEIINNEIGYLVTFEVEI